MKVLVQATTLFGAVTLMLAIIVAQRNYQRSWDSTAAVQTVAPGAVAQAAPERLADAN